MCAGQVKFTLYNVLTAGTINECLKDSNESHITGGGEDFSQGTMSCDTDQSEASSQSAIRSLLTTEWSSLYILCSRDSMGHTTPKIAPSHRGYRPHIIHNSLHPCDSVPQNSISIGSSAFAWFIHVTTMDATCNLCSNRPHLCDAA